MMTAATEDTLKRWLDRALEAATLAEVFGVEKKEDAGSA
jgi:hypothetical protein